MHGVQGQMHIWPGRGGKMVSDADRLKTGGVLALSGNIMENQPEHVMLDEERVVARLENEVLHEGLWNVLVRLKLAKNVDEDPSVKHWLTVHRRDQVGNFLEGKGAQLLHDLGTPLHLLALEGEQRLLGVVQRLQLRSRRRIVKHLVVLGGEGLAYRLVVRIQSHLPPSKSQH